MDSETPSSIEAVTDEGGYLRRAQALVATRGELFLAAPVRSQRLAGTAGPPKDRAASPFRQRDRQLILPLSRERTRRRARMVR